MTSLFFFIFGVLSIFLPSATLWLCALSLLSLIFTPMGLWRGLVGARVGFLVGVKIRVGARLMVEVGFRVKFGVRL